MSAISPDEDDEDEPTIRQQAAAERAWRENKPEGNPFAEVIEELRDQGMTFAEIKTHWRAADKAFEEALGEERWMLIPEWRITVLVDDQNTPSGKRYETYERSGRDRKEVEERVESHTGWPVDSEKTEQIGYVKVY